MILLHHSRYWSLFERPDRTNMAAQVMRQILSVGKRWIWVSWWTMMKHNKTHHEIILNLIVLELMHMPAVKFLGWKSWLLLLHKAGNIQFIFLFGCVSLFCSGQLHWQSWAQRQAATSTAWERDFALDEVSSRPQSESWAWFSMYMYDLVSASTSTSTSR